MDVVVRCSMCWMLEVGCWRLDGRAAWTSINQRQDLSLFVIVTLWKLKWKKFIAADICIKFIVPSDQQHYIQAIVTSERTGTIPSFVGLWINGAHRLRIFKNSDSIF
jgi:hypothetical protein